MKYVRHIPWYVKHTLGIAVDTPAWKSVYSYWIFLVCQHTFLQWSDYGRLQICIVHVWRWNNFKDQHASVQHKYLMRVRNSKDWYGCGIAHITYCSLWLQLCSAELFNHAVISLPYSIAFKWVRTWDYNVYSIIEKLYSPQNIA